MNSKVKETELTFFQPQSYLFNSDGYGYGLFPTDLNYIELWGGLNDVEKGSLLITIYENLLDGNINPTEYLNKLTPIIQTEENQLVLNLALGHLRSIYWNMIPDKERNQKAASLEELLWTTMLYQEESSRRKTFFNSYESIALSETGIEKIYAIWSKETKVEKLILSENDFIGLAGTLALKSPEKAAEIVEKQLTEIKNPDSRRRFEFIKPALSNDKTIRDAFFNSLALEENRQTESWVLGALGYLHHPLRTSDSEKYILPGLELLEEIQVTGDIFFPKRWLDTILGNYHSDEAISTVNTFLTEHPNYNAQLKMKILQSADMLKRTNSIAQNN